MTTCCSSSERLRKSFQICHKNVIIKNEEGPIIHKTGVLRIVPNSDISWFCCLFMCKYLSHQDNNYSHLVSNPNPKPTQLLRSIFLRPNLSSSGWDEERSQNWPQSYQGHEMKFNTESKWWWFGKKADEFDGCPLLLKPLLYPPVTWMGADKIPLWGGG